MAKRLPLTEWRAIPRTCSCETCQSMCKVPCWPSPDEYRQLVALGYGSKMMLTDRGHPTEDRYITVIAPAKRGREGKDNVADGENCVFQNDAGLCDLHNICKPLEGRLAICENDFKGKEPVDLRDRVASLWDNPEAIELVRGWITIYGNGGWEDWDEEDGVYYYYGDIDEDESTDETADDLASELTQGVS